MKATVTNKSATAISVGYNSVAPGTTKSVDGLSLAQALQAQKLNATAGVFVRLEQDAADKPTWYAQMLAPADPAGGVKTLAGNGFGIYDAASGGNAQSSAETVSLQLFDDAACTIPSVAATITAVASGTIQSGLGTNMVQATTNASGVLSCTVTVPSAQAVYVKAGSGVSPTHILDGSAVHKITFS